MGALRVMYIYIYIYIEREREIDIDTCVYIYIYRERERCIVCIRIYEVPRLSGLTPASPWPKRSQRGYTMIGIYDTIIYYIL